MICLTHLEVCPYCYHVALKVCEFDEPYSRVEAICLCCGYTIADKIPKHYDLSFKNILELLSRKQIGAVCVDNDCGSTNIIKLIDEGNYKEFRCLDCGAEWNSKELQYAIKNVKRVWECLQREEVEDCVRAKEGECPICKNDIGHKRNGYLVEISCSLCGFHNIYEEKIPNFDVSQIDCKDYQKAEMPG